MASDLKIVLTHLINTYEETKGTSVEVPMRRVVTQIFNEIMGNKTRRKKIDPLMPNKAEVDEGRFVGKLHAVKMYRDRTGCGLRQCIENLTKYFEDNRYEFKQ